mmetsp:Transcript_9780/g.12077  ORF Transcript_9780/g.12077 Transcript_9780/m.12077 type:complete len:254 (-) Transcript_9780:279-1040(-)|eukprot:scaffold24531_cov26-Tisochrysis_lutea.AAC.2
MGVKLFALPLLAARASAFSTIPGVGEPLPGDLTSGKATATGPYPDGGTSCGGMTNKVPDGFIMAAIPWSYFKQFNPDGALNTQKGTASCASDCFLHDADDKALCFQLSKTDGTQVKKVIIGDVCAGNCRSQQGTCGADSISCLDFSLYTDKAYRCPPSSFVYSTMHNGDDLLSLSSDDALWPGLMFNGNASCCQPSDGYPVIQGGSSGDHWDWCAGYNMHFDLQKDEFTDAANIVINYERIDCPDDLSGKYCA